MNTKIAGAIVILLIGAGAGYWAGSAYGGAKAPARAGGAAGQFARGGTGATGVGARAAGGGFATGQVVSKDASSITLKMSNGNTEIVLVGTSTPVMKQATGSVSDLSVGTEVVATGSANSDGSLSASSIQIRPAGATGPANQPPQAQ